MLKHCRLLISSLPVLLTLALCSIDLVAIGQNSKLDFGKRDALGYNARRTTEIAKAESSGFGPRYSPTESQAYTEYFRNYDLWHLDAHWFVDPAISYIRGEIDYRLQVIKDQTGEIWFALDDTLGVDSVLLDGNSTLFDHKDGYLQVALSTPNLSPSYQGYVCTWPKCMVVPLRQGIYLNLLW